MQIMLDSCIASRNLATGTAVNQRFKKDINNKSSKGKFRPPLKTFSPLLWPSIFVQSVFLQKHTSSQRASLAMKANQKAPVISLPKEAASRR